MQDTQPYQTMSSWIMLCHAGTGFGHLVLLKEILNATVSKYILDNYVFLTLWQSFGEEPQMGVMVRCQHKFGHSLAC